ncbi:MAG: hypothetical protein CME31_06315, partial [Gimesia sp.]|nr:hypothetical protein [Gimesia sp.]
MKGFIGNSSSLHLATATYPKYYLDNAVTDKGTVVIVKPDPTDSATARVLYVDSSKIDDDCDLRSAVVFHAASKEFEKLASAQNSDITTALTAMNTELDETQAVCDKIDADLVLAKAEVVLAKAEAAELATNTDNSSNFETACDAMATELGKVDEICTLANEEFDEVAVEASGTATSAISLARTAAPSIIAVSDLSIAAVPPDVPTITASTVSFSTTAPSYASPTTTISGVAWSTEYPSQASAVTTALTAINTELDELLAIADNVHTEAGLVNAEADKAVTEIGLANAEVDKMATEVGLDNAELDLAKVEIAEAAVLVDSDIDTATAAIATAAGRVNTAVVLANGQFDASVLEAAQAEGEADDSAIATALGAINTQIDSAVSIAGNMHTYLGNANTRIGTAKDEIDLAKGEAAEIATQTDNGGDIETALDAINTALDKFRADGAAPALFGDASSYTSSVGITKVKAALDKAIALVDGDSPSADTDAHAWIVDE